MDDSMKESEGQIGEIDGDGGPLRLDVKMIRERTFGLGGGGKSLSIYCHIGICVL